MVKDLKDDWDTHWEDFSEGTKMNPAEKFRINLVLNELSLKAKQEDMIIDFGSGSGMFLIEMAKLYPNMKKIGFEYSATGVALAKRNLPQAEFFQKNMLSEEYYPKEYIGKSDFGVCTEVLEHMDDPIIFLKHAKMYLKKGAKMVITVPGGRMSAFDRYLGHRGHFTTKQLSEMLRCAGFLNYTVRAAGFPFFNLYKWASIIRGEKLIEDYKQINSKKKLSVFQTCVAKVLNVLFCLNLNSTPFGWQIIGVAENE